MKNRTEDLIPLEKFEDICRLCLMEHDSIPLSDVLNTELFNVFYPLRCIKINENSAFPNFICVGCKKQIEDIELFLSQCHDSNSILNKSVQSVETFTLEADGSAIDSQKVIQLEQDIYFPNDKSDNASTGEESPKRLEEDDNLCEDNADICSPKSQTQEDGDNCTKNDNRIDLSADSTKFVCTICSRELTSSWALKSHMKTHTGEKPFACTHCEQKFAYRNSLIVHTRIHTGDKPYVCKICNKGYHSSTNLRKHNKVKHFMLEDVQNDNTNLKKCKICEKTFHKNGFGHHIRMHAAEKKDFTCLLCNKKFLKNSHLQRHIRIHTGEKPFTCDLCLRSFNQDGDLKRHMIIHTNTKGFQCQHCGKQYVTKGGLDNHLSTHTDVRTDGKFKCEFCSRSFNQTAQYKMHINSHTGEKPFLCTTCGKSFTANSTLKIHIRIHTGEMPYVCNYCDQSFTNASSMKQHVMRKHTCEKNFKCVVCHKQYFNSTNLKNHRLRAHSLVDKIRVEKETKKL